MKTKQKIISFLLVGMFVFIAGITAVSAVPANDASGTNSGSSHIPSNVSDQTQKANQRAITVSQSGNDAQFTSRSLNKPGITIINFKLTADTSGLGIKVEYTSQSNSSHIEFTFHVAFTKIIEYIDVNSNGIYDANDTTVQTMNLNSWQAITIQNESVSSGTSMYVLTANTTNNVFSAQIFVPENFVTLNNTVITPTELKVNIAINGFPFQDTSSRLALYTDLLSESHYQQETKTSDEQNGFANNESGISTSYGGYSGEFTWANTALVDGSSLNVLTSPVQSVNNSGNNQMIYLNYPHGTSILHDPTVGMTGLLTLSTIGISPLIYIAVDVLLIGVAVTIVWVRRRTRA